MNKRGWHNESGRHSLAARGIRTTSTGKIYIDWEGKKEEYNDILNMEIKSIAGKKTSTVGKIIGRVDEDTFYMVMEDILSDCLQMGISVETIPNASEFLAHHKTSISKLNRSSPKKEQFVSAYNELTTVPNVLMVLPKDYVEEYFESLLHDLQVPY